MNRKSKNFAIVAITAILMVPLFSNFLGSTPPLRAKSHKSGVGVMFLQDIVGRVFPSGGTQVFEGNLNQYFETQMAIDQFVITFEMGNYWLRRRGANNQITREDRVGLVLIANGFLVLGNGFNESCTGRCEPNACGVKSTGGCTCQDSCPNDLKPAELMSIMAY